MYREKKIAVQYNVGRGYQIQRERDSDTHTDRQTNIQTQAHTQKETCTHTVIVEVALTAPVFLTVRGYQGHIVSDLFQR
jgi:hypothetical protein